MARTNATCTYCGGEFPVAEMIGTTSAKRGKNVAYMCQRCATSNQHYHASNNEVLGTDKQNLVFCGIEFECSYSDEYARNAMFEYRFMPTHDSSLDSEGYGNRYGRDGNTTEYVSGLMKGLNRASKFALTCDYLVSNGHLSVNYSCGTHFHVSINSMKDGNGEKRYMGYIRRYYHSLFEPLAKAMRENPEKTEEIFGRYFTDYARDIEPRIETRTNEQGVEEEVVIHADENSRYNFVNVKNNSNIEFRLNKFVSGKQYQNLMKMEVEMVKCIVTNFCEHFTTKTTEIDARRYYKQQHFKDTGEKLPSKDSFRKHKAQVTAKKLVAIFEKYANI